MKKYLLFIIAAAFLALASCSPFQVRSDYAQTANFNQYKSYKLRIDDLNINDIDKDRVLNELSRQLQSKGLMPAENPDVIINIKASHKLVNDVQSAPYYGVYGYGYPYGFGVGFGRTWTNSYNRGALVIDMIDAQTQKLVWQGIGSGINVDSPKSKQKEIPQIVAEIMANYPPKKN